MELWMCPCTTMNAVSHTSCQSCDGSMADGRG
jgi:hypothetical protein